MSAISVPIQWKNPNNELPPPNKNAYWRDKYLSPVVLIWVGENDYSHRETTIAYYDHSNNEWEYIERKYADYPVKLWSYLPEPELSE